MAQIRHFGEGCGVTIGLAISISSISTQRTTTNPADSLQCKFSDAEDTESAICVVPKEFIECRISSRSSQNQKDVLTERPHIGQKAGIFINLINTF